MKRIAICADGTWNKPDQKDRGKRKPTNVVKTARGLLPRTHDNVTQIAYYHDGVGTNWGLDKIAGGGFGLGLSANIVDAYQFLVLNYEPGDEIFLFGFSRGAYTVRSLAGLIDMLGVLPKDNAFYIPDGYKLYRERKSDSEIDSFRIEHNSRECKIKFVGVWDTVGALGIPIGIFKSFNNKYQFHEVGLSVNIENAYQALAIDERRRPFQPSLWTLPDGSTQTLQQVWFPGVHSNVGGGYSKDGLANSALHWIKERAAEHGLQFDDSFLGYYRPWHKHELRDSMTWAYRLLIPKWREIGEGNNSNESVHESAFLRMDDMLDYRPKNLLNYIKRHGRT